MVILNNISGKCQLGNGLNKFLFQTEIIHYSEKKI